MMFGICIFSNLMTYTFYNKKKEGLEKLIMSERGERSRSI
jgi:hypothetical protein